MNCFLKELFIVLFFIFSTSSFLSLLEIASKALSLNVGGLNTPFNKSFRDANDQSFLKMVC